MARKKAESTEQVAEQSTRTFTKSQLTGSKRFANRKDLLNALLKNDQLYTVSEVEQIIENFLKGKVK
ncbi:MAG: hypothetical protein LUG61_11145 [Lachnospiraceae bacterium]|nr:hypothetical protein [Lachnospiraceae bacterium]